MPSTEHVAPTPLFSVLHSSAPTLFHSIRTNSYFPFSPPISRTHLLSKKNLPLTSVSSALSSLFLFPFPFLSSQRRGRGRREGGESQIHLSMSHQSMDKYPNNPYLSYPDHHARIHGSSGKTNLASCVVATAFLIVVFLVLSLVFFLLFRPRDPTIQISAVQFPGFAARNGSVSFTFAQYASVHNPNRATFSHYDSTIRLLYAGNQVGFMYIPAGDIAAGRTQYMEASFAVTQFPLLQKQPQINSSNSTISVISASAAVNSGNMEVVSRMKLKGRVRVLRFFMHQVKATAACRVGLAAATGAVLGVRC